MKRKAKIIVPAILILVIAAAAAVYFFMFETFTIVQDTLWKQIMPISSYLDLGIKLAKEKTRLRIVTIDQNTAFDEVGLSQTFAKLDTGEKILASPVITAAAIYMNIDVEELLVQSYVYGIGPDNGKGLFDTVLTSDDLSGWSMAAKTVWQENMVAAVVADASSHNQCREVYTIINDNSNVNVDSVYKYNVDDYGSVFAAAILEDMMENGVNIVFCPHTDLMRDFFTKDENNLKWVTDYRFSYVVPKSNLLGVVCPDIYTSIKTGDGVLHYEYRSVK